MLIRRCVSIVELSPFRLLGPRNCTKSLVVNEPVQCQIPNSKRTGIRRRTIAGQEINVGHNELFTHNPTSNSEVAALRIYL